MDLWGWIHDERRGLVETFEGLSDEQWATPSLCGAWTVRQVLGHLVVGADPRLRHFLVPVAKARGSFDRANDQLAREEAERPVEELLARYRARLDGRRTPPGFGAAAPLGDILLHSLDVRVPLGLPLDRPAERYRPVLDLLFTRRAIAGFVPRGRPKLRWVATDLEWSHGAGAEVAGAMADLTMAASGRGARVAELSGPGQPALASWLG